MSAVPVWSPDLVSTLARAAPELRTGAAHLAPQVVAAALTATVPGCGSAGLVFPVLRSEGRVDRPFRDAVTDPALLGVLAAETAARSGPIREVRRAVPGEARHLADVTTETRWPQFTTRLRSDVPGVLALAVVPVDVATRCVVVLASPDRHGLDGIAEHLDALVAPLELFLRLAWAETRARHLRDGLDAHGVVATATGVVMAEDGVSAPAALAALRTTAQDSGRPLRVVAEEVVSDSRTPRPR